MFFQLMQRWQSEHLAFGFLKWKSQVRQAQVSEIRDLRNTQRMTKAIQKFEQLAKNQRIGHVFQGFRRWKRKTVKLRTLARHRGARKIQSFVRRRILAFQKGPEQLLASLFVVEPCEDTEEEGENDDFEYVNISIFFDYEYYAHMWR